VDGNKADEEMAKIAVLPKEKYVTIIQANT
jgi:hypothetical protein